jgi:hypothetical protein
MPSITENGENVSLIAADLLILCTVPSCGSPDKALVRTSKSTLLKVKSANPKLRQPSLSVPYFKNIDGGRPDQNLEALLTHGRMKDGTF